METHLLEIDLQDPPEEEDSRPRSFSYNPIDSVVLFLVGLGFLLLVALLIWFLVVHL